MHSSFLSHSSSFMGEGVKKIALFYIALILLLGFHILWILGASQEIYGCVVDKNVTPDRPEHLVSLEQIKQDLINRAAVSDFSVCKEKVQVSGNNCNTVLKHVCPLNEF